VHVADVAGVVVARDDEHVGALDPLEIALGQEVVLAETHLRKVPGAQDDVRIELVDLHDGPVHQVGHEVHRARMKIRDVGDGDRPSMFA
jgi:hypothetical protein